MGVINATRTGHRANKRTSLNLDAIKLGSEAVVDNKHVVGFNVLVLGLAAEHPLVRLAHRQ